MEEVLAYKKRRVDKKIIPEVQFRLMDSASGSHSANSVQWKFLGEKVPRAEIVYFAQLFLCLTLIITSVVMLALKEPNRDF